VVGRGKLLKVKRMRRRKGNPGCLGGSRSDVALHAEE